MWLEFLFLSPLLWVPLLLVLITITALLIEAENASFATGILIVVLVLLQIGTSVEPFTWVIHNPLVFLVGLAAYLLIGAVWGRFKWRLFVSDRMNALGGATRDSRLKYESYLKDPQNRDRYSKLAREEAMDVAFSGYGGHGVKLPLQVTKFKSRIIAWMMYWPISLLHFVFYDTISRFYNWAYRVMSESFQRYSNTAYEEHKAKFGED